MKSRLSSIPEALEEIKRGKFVIVIDDDTRENEGDFVATAENITPEMINFMATYGRGLICVPVTRERAKQLQLELMVKDEENSSRHKTQFTVSVDLLGHGCTTGISASDRAKTIKAIASYETTPADLGRPGHIFPLIAAAGGVLERNGHTEASVDLVKLAGFAPVAVLVEIMNTDGSMARLPQLKELAQKFDMKIISIKDLIAYRILHE